MIWPIRNRQRKPLASVRRTDINKARRSRVRTEVRKVEEAIAKGDRGCRQTALKDAAPELMRGAQKNVIHKNAASRKVSRLTKRVKSMSG